MRYMLLELIVQVVLIKCISISLCYVNTVLVVVRLQTYSIEE